MNARHKQGLVLAIHPTSRGFGWALFENPLAPVDWGLTRVTAKRSARLLARFEKLLNRYEPKVVVFEEFHDHLARRAKRIQELCRQMIVLANHRGIYTPIYNRETIRDCFASSSVRTRHDIALSISKQIEVFRRRLPRERRRWDSEDVRQSLFDAVALALTYFAVDGRKTVSSQS